MSGLHWPIRRRGVDLVPLGLLCAGAALGAAFAGTAWAFHPLLLPALLAVAALVVATLREPAIGVAAGFLLVPLSNLGITGEPPWAATTAWGAFLCVLGLWRLAPSGATGRMPVVALAIGANLLVAAVAFVAGGAGEEGYSELRSLATGFLYFTGIALLIRTPRQVLWCLGGVAAATALVGALAARERLLGTVTAQAFYTPDGALVGRVAGGFGHPNELGGFLVVLIPFVLAGLLLARRGRWAFAAALALGTFGIYVSFSRGALVALVLIPFFFMRGRRVLMLAPILAILLAVATPGLVRERFATLTESGSEVSTRVDFWVTAVSVWQQQPLLGAGLGRFPEAYAEARVPGRGFLPGTLSQPPPHAHNLFLQALSTEGLLGFVALLAILASGVAVALALRRSDDRNASIVGTAALAGLVAFTTHNQFDVTLLEGTGIYFWALMGIAAGVWMRTTEEPTA